MSSDDIEAMAVSMPKPKNRTTFSKTAPKTTQPKTNSPSNSSRPKCDAKIEKDNFSQSFKTMTMTMGALASCIHRATSLTREEARCIADRLDEAVHIFNVARTIGYKAIENFIYVKVPKSSSLVVPEETHASEFAELDSMEHDIYETSQPAEQPVEQPDEQPVEQTESGSLDLILDPVHGLTVIRNLVSIILKGSITERSTEMAQESVDARNTAVDIYEEYCKVVDLEPVNPTKIPLGIPIADLAVNIYNDISMHFRRLPKLIVDKVIDPRSKPVGPKQEAFDTDPNLDIR